MKGSWVVAVLAVAGFAGCGSEESRVKLVPVSGKVTLNGKPLANATVTYMPDKSNAYSTPATDSTGPEGNYMMMWKNRKGISPGKYTVIVTPAAADPTNDPRYASFKDDPYMAQVSAAASAGNGIPGSGKGTSDLTKNEFSVEVGDQPEEFDFDAKGKASAGGSAK